MTSVSEERQYPLAFAKWFLGQDDLSSDDLPVIFMVWAKLTRNKHGSASAYDGEKRSHIAASTAGESPAAPATPEQMQKAVQAMTRAIASKDTEPPLYDLPPDEWIRSWEKTANAALQALIDLGWKP